MNILKQFFALNQIDQLVIVVAFAFLGLFILLSLAFRCYEKKKWNKGFCKCGGCWRKFCTDSQCERGYICDACKTVCWITCQVDKEHY